MGFPSDGSGTGGRGCVLVTGANGFTGKYVRAELESAGYTVCGAVMGAPRSADEVTLDITSPDECRRVMERVRPDYLVHLAGIAFVQHADADAFYRVNVIGTINLLQAMADVGLAPKRVLAVSSANVYGNAKAGVISESEPPQPVNHYAVSKIAMEYMVKTWSDRFPIVLTRPFNYTGVGQQPYFLVPKIVSHFTQREPVIELGNLDVERDFSDVRTVAHVYRLLLERKCEGETVNVCSGRPYSLRAVLGMMREIAGFDIEVRVNPAYVRQSEVRTLVGSKEKLHRLVGDVKAYSMEDTLRWMVENDADHPQIRG